MEMKHVAAAIRRRIHTPVIWDSPPDHRATIFVAGSGRSGTTWLSELLLHGTRRRYIFEPLSRNHSFAQPFHDQFGKLYLRDRITTPLRSYAENMERFDAMKEILTGRTRSRWTERFNRRLICHGRLVKEIRANLLLGWIQVNFPEMPTILMLRHPCAVAASFVREGWKGRIDEMIMQPQLVCDHLTPYQGELLNSLVNEDLFLRAIGIWCIETLVALRQIQGAHLILYEDLVGDPEQTLGNLFQFLGRKDLNEVLGRMDRPSSTTRTTRVSLTDRLGSWRSELTTTQIREAFRIVRAFNLDAFYDEHPLPLHPNLGDWLLPWKAST